MTTQRRGMMTFDLEVCTDHECHQAPVAVLIVAVPNFDTQEIPYCPKHLPYYIGKFKQAGPDIHLDVEYL